MSKFVIECPNCHNYTTASHVFHRHVDCTCGYEISVSRDKMSAKQCPNCHNTVVYDQSKGDKATCPVCKQPVNTAESLRNAVEIHCPSCACKLIVDKNKEKETCPLCETDIDIKKQISKEFVKNKGLASVIKYEGGNDVFVWKHPIEDFNLGSQLIVHESQEALFFRDGQALDLFGAGRYTLATQNLPALETLYKLPTNSDEVFHSEVYFINKTTQMGIKWGTDSKVRLFDPASGISLEIGAYGEFNLCVENSRKFLLKVVGTAGSFTQTDVMGEKAYTTKSATAHFRSLIVSKVKANLARSIKENGINILEVDERTDEIAEILRIRINEVLEEYGLVMPQFYITAISLPMDDPDVVKMIRQYKERVLRTREADIENEVAQAERGAKLTKAETEAMLSRIKAEGEAQAEAIRQRTAIETRVSGIRSVGEAKADAYHAQAMAEAAEMKAKGYTYRDETSRQVGLEAMQNGITGNAGGSMGALGDVASLGVTLGAMGGVIGMTKDALNPIMNSANEFGAGIGDVVAGKVSGTSDIWDCACGAKGIAGNFCSDCGAKKPAPVETWDCSCGNKGITGNFCSNCGAKKPEPPKAWDCACGKKGITGNFCSNCGAKKPEETERWDCSCGRTGITGNFCDNCGKSKEV